MYQTVEERGHRLAKPRFLSRQQKVCGGALDFPVDNQKRYQLLKKRRRKALRSPPKSFLEAVLVENELLVKERQKLNVGKNIPPQNNLAAVAVPEPMTRRTKLPGVAVGPFQILVDRGNRNRGGDPNDYEVKLMLPRMNPMSAFVVRAVVQAN